MKRVDAALFYLPIAALVFSAVSLGLSITATVRSEGWVGWWELQADGKLVRLGDLYIRAPWPYKFLIAISAWSMLVCSALLVAPIIITRRALNWHTGFRWTVLITNITTFGLWFTAFINLILVFGANPMTDIPAAMETFAILPWLCFMALAILNVFTSYGHLQSSRHGYGGLFRKYEKTFTPEEAERGATESTEDLVN